MAAIDPTQRTDIYFKREIVYQNQMARLEAWKGAAGDRDLIRAFQAHLFARGTQKYRVGKVTAALRRLCDMTRSDLDSLEKREAEQLVAQINTTDAWKEHTKSDYRRALKQFYRWYEDEDPRLNGTLQERETARRLYKYLNKDVRSKPRATSLDYASIITETEARQIIADGCGTTFERAAIAVLHESGCRIGEFLGMRLRDVERKDRHAIIRVDGKTGERRIPIIQSVPWLNQWIQDHPYKDNPDALLWISNQHRYRGQPLHYAGIKKLLKRVCERAGVRKKSTPHWFRHSRATILAPRYSESVLCKMMGWALGSKQVRTYVHLGARQVEDEFLKEHGLAPTTPKTPAVQFCVCGATNDGGARYCFKCGNALNVATIIEDETKKRDAIEEATQLLVQIMSTPELRERFEAHQKNGGKTT